VRACGRAADDSFAVSQCCWSSCAIDPNRVSASRNHIYASLHPLSMRFQGAKRLRLPRPADRLALHQFAVVLSNKGPRNTSSSNEAPCNWSGQGTRNETRHSAKDINPVRNNVAGCLTARNALNIWWTRGRAVHWNPSVRPERRFKPNARYLNATRTIFVAVQWLNDSMGRVGRLRRS
jgi:hypothetical protein